MGDIRFYKYLDFMNLTTFFAIEKIVKTITGTPRKQAIIASRILIESFNA